MVQLVRICSYSKLNNRLMISIRSMRASGDSVPSENVEKRG